jgi:hypothetical protein
VPAPKAQQQVFGPPLHRVEQPPLDAGGQVAATGTRRRGLRTTSRAQARPCDVRPDAAAGGLDFRQFGHRADREALRGRRTRGRVAAGAAICLPWHEPNCSRALEASAAPKQAPGCRRAPRDLPQPTEAAPESSHENPARPPRPLPLPGLRARRRRRRDGGQRRRAAEGSLPAQELTPRTLYHFLLAEIAGARGQIGLSAQLYLDLARSTRDPRIARRATEIAMYSRNLVMARGAAEIWTEVAPDSEEARRVLAGLSGAGRAEDINLEPSSSSSRACSRSRTAASRRTC